MRFSDPRQVLLMPPIPQSAIGDPADIEELDRGSNWPIPPFPDATRGIISP